MAKLAELVENVRSKNAGPFWLTIDIFCGSKSSYKRVCVGLDTLHIARIFGITEEKIKRFEINSLNVIKFSLPRPYVQGSLKDRDMHGASWSSLLEELFID